MTIFDYCILGGGALGSVFAGKLALAGFKVQMLTRSPGHPRAIEQNGLQLDDDGKSLTIHFSATTVENAEPATTVMLFTKTHQTDAAIKGVLNKMANANFVSLQNGLGNGARLAQYADPSHIVHGNTLVPADLLGPGHVSTHGPANSSFGAFSPEAEPLAKQLQADLTRAGFDVELVEDIELKIWQKACFNVAMNGLCALTRGSPGLLNYCADGQVLAHELVDEAVSVARAEGVSIEAPRVHDMVDFACEHHTWHKPSMLQDIEAKRTTEIDALNGYIHERAQYHGLATPLNDMILRMMRIAERSPEFWAGRD